MSKFDFMGFGCNGGYDDMFVAHAKKYTAAQTVELCKREFEHKFKSRSIYGREIPALREPTAEDVQDVHCAFRFGVDPAWPDGCYTLVGEGDAGAFPVHVIDFERLKREA